MVLITGGGTGGHLKVVKNIKNELNKRGIKPVFIGSLNGQDRAWFEGDSGFEATYFLDTMGFVNQKIGGKINSSFKITKALFESISIFKKHEIKKVFSVGGFSAAPASFAAILSLKELYIHEQNSRIGNLNRILKPFSKAFFSSYFESPIRDYPVESIFFEKARVRESIETIIFLGGSQGASAINALAIAVAEDLAKMGIKIIHQCGKLEYQKMQEAYNKLGIEVDLFDFDKNIVDKIAKADFAVSRAGASTLWELVANGCPALFIPYPYAASNHQYYNALFLVKRNLGYILTQDELTKERFLELFKKEILLKNVSKMSLLLVSSFKRDGAKRIVEFILSS